MKKLACLLLASFFSFYCLAAEVAFSTPYFKANVNGDMITLGNTIIRKDQTGVNNQYGVDINTTSLPNDRNNAYTMKFVDVLNDGTTTFNSSSATLNLPSTYKIEWAGLYWQGHICNQILDNGADNSKIGTGNNQTAIYNNAKSKANKVYFRQPDGTSNTLTAQAFYDFPTNISGGIDRRYLYSGFYNITNYVRDSNQTVKNGTYTIGNIITSEGQIDEWGGLGGWAMLVIYKDSTGTLQLKNVSIFHGYRILGSGETETINISGFLTPSAGLVNASVAIFVMDGDKSGANSTGERLKLWNTSNNLTDITNTTNPLNNVFNSTITNLGVDNITRTPFFTDNLGLDLDRFNVSSYMKNNQTNTRIELSTSGDLYTIGLIAFATDIYQPFITINKSSSASTLAPNQPITYTANIRNAGNENAKDIVIYDNFRDNNLSRIDGSLTNPLITLEDMLDKNITAITNSLICTYGPLNTNCKNSCSITASPLKVSCTIPTLNVNQTAFMQFQTKLAANPDTQGQDVNFENKMYATYSNALTNQFITEAAQSNSLLTGIYFGSLSNMTFNAWETTLSRLNPKLYSKSVGNTISFDIGDSNGTSFNGSICAKLVSSTGILIANYQCHTYNNNTSQSFTWNSSSIANQNVYVNIMATSTQNQSDPNVGIWLESNSTERFSIRPNHFEFDLSTLPTKFKAGEDYNLTVYAYPLEGTTPVPGYNQGKENLSLSVDKYMPPPNNTINNTLNGNLTFASNNFSFIDGSTLSMGINYSDVGIINIKLDDTNWSSIDASDDAFNPISNRTIHGEVNMTFIPFDFNISNIVIKNNNDAAFTYLSNDLNMSAKLGLILTARNKQGATTLNYSDLLYERNISLTPWIHYNSIDANNTKMSNQDLPFTNGISTINWDSNNSVKFNFIRNNLVPINPFDINGSNVSLSAIDTDFVRGDANGTATGNATFYYGRVNSPDYRFSGNNGNATIYYEVYAKDLNQTQRQAFGLNGLQSINAIDWYQNTLHDALSDGNASYSSLSSGSYASSISPTLSLNIVNGQETLQLSNTNKPYVDKIQIIPSSWLTYPNTTTNFLVEFLGRGNWGGEGSVDRNTSGNVGKITNENNITRSNKRLNW